LVAAFMAASLSRADTGEPSYAVGFAPRTVILEKSHAGAKIAISSVGNPNVVRSEKDFETIIIAQRQK
jgi:hypothetical protein